jgi:hypothetical protein
VTRGRTVLSLISEDLATYPELAERALAAGRELGARLVVQGVAVPAVRVLAEEEDLAGLIARLHEELLPGGPEEVVE